MPNWQFAGATDAITRGASSLAAVGLSAGAAPFALIGCIQREAKVAPLDICALFAGVRTTQLVQSLSFDST